MKARDSKTLRVSNRERQDMQNWMTSESFPRPMPYSWSRVSCFFRKHMFRMHDIRVPKIRDQVEVRELRYSQLSCKETFQCGRSVSHLNSTHCPCRSLAPLGASRVCCDVMFDRTNPDPAIFQVSTTKVQQPRPLIQQERSSD